MVYMYPRILYSVYSHILVFCTQYTLISSYFVFSILSYPRILYSVYSHILVFCIQYTLISSYFVLSILSYPRILQSVYSHILVFCIQYTQLAEYYVNFCVLAPLSFTHFGDMFRAKKLRPKSHTDMCRQTDLKTSQEIH